MSDAADRNSPGPDRSNPGSEGRTLDKGAKPAGKRAPLGDPATRGRTTIADGVVEKIAGLAARDVLGVHAMGTGFARTFGAVRDRVPGGGQSVARGVKAEVGEVQTALDLDIVVEYGVSIVDVARAVRENVIAAVERMTGLEVVEVNVAVGDVKLPDEEDDEDDEREQRVQ
ncbi:Asp23/Gls24 family envelope stress response protein [Streptomyces sp. H10-C2]|uniref:Asp23/Gls24 family envelope stress response protein n=1 Tax=unclassified Streptomyces TaxID=2593676 RepID=UPI0024BBC026|nr:MULTISPECIES: Asp23/Gls24 family envelope stress response protein [unclassified Streptomyces]MDJ0344063.1 Asp23/Gls24 family envelope stress response protein [Streptomyces sp. PH10-H1]MDJ0368602.1 Asp23/Gls24 family envelope stress response protein [Streptomyces sp. H10-C2]